MRSASWPFGGAVRATTSRSDMGIAQGFATLGRIGFEGRFDYAAIGSVTNLAARLCSDAGPWQVLVTDRMLAAIEHWPSPKSSATCNPRDSAARSRVHNICEMNEVNA